MGRRIVVDVGVGGVEESTAAKRLDHRLVTLRVAGLLGVAVGVTRRGLTGLPWEEEDRFVGDLGGVEGGT